ncbi:hypothetical protein HWV62_13880 [Athelia sp. TMB]|nr:hypothetical protein HWV62_13880 [Athelia sp. TMB]
MAAPDARTRKVSMMPSSHRVRSTSIPANIIPQVLLSNILFALAIHAGKECVLKYDVGIFWVTLRVLAFGGLAVLIKEAFTGELTKKKSIEAVDRSGNVITVAARATMQLVHHFVSDVFNTSVVEPVSARKTSAVLLSLALSFLSDIAITGGDFRALMPAYVGLLAHALSSSGLEHTHGVLSPALGPTFTTAASTLGACLLFLPFYMFREVILNFPVTPALPLTSLAALPLLAYALLFLSPNTSRSHNNASYSPRFFMISYPSAFIFACIIGATVFGLYPSFMDLLVGGLLFYGLYPVDISSLSVPTRTPTARLIRSYLKTILSNPESRKIFYFLLLNLSYMGVQMMYGVWTNSLGLISDAIHMAFDCMAIGMGLFASVMATWAPNERFTYGYGRIETLSGFANGIFLVLISIFIVFEAIQRIHSHASLEESHSHSHAPQSTTQNSHSHSSSNGMHTPEHQHEDHSHSPSHSHSHSPTTPATCEDHDSHDHSHSHSPTSPIPAPGNHNGHSHSAQEQGRPAHSRHNSLQIHVKQPSQDISYPANSGSLMEFSPLTPHYKFGHDEHFDAHHASDHAPNLHAPDLHKPHAHEGHSHNMRGVFLHVMADTLGSVGVIISTLLIQFYGWTGFDPIASLFIAILIAASVIPLVIDTGKVLCLDVDHRERDIQQALAELPSVEGLASYKSPRFWPKDASSLIGSIHIQLSPSASSSDPTGPHSTTRVTYTNVDRVVERVDALLRSKISGLEELTIQVEGRS